MELCNVVLVCRIRRRRWFIRRACACSSRWRLVWSACTGSCGRWPLWRPRSCASRGWPLWRTAAAAAASWWSVWGRFWSPSTCCWWTVWTAGRPFRRACTGASCWGLIWSPRPCSCWRWSVWCSCPRWRLVRGACRRTHSNAELVRPARATTWRTVWKCIWSAATANAEWLWVIWATTAAAATAAAGRRLVWGFYQLVRCARPRAVRRRPLRRAAATAAASGRSVWRRLCGWRCRCCGGGDGQPAPRADGLRLRRQDGPDDQVRGPHRHARVRRQVLRGAAVGGLPEAGRYHARAHGGLACCCTCACSGTFGRRPVRRACTSPCSCTFRPVWGTRARTGGCKPIRWPLWCPATRAAAACFQFVWRTCTGACCWRLVRCPRPRARCWGALRQSDRSSTCAGRIWWPVWGSCAGACCGRTLRWRTIR